jgi:hypothetical protein
LVPVTVTADADEPVTIAFGESAVIVGTTLLTVSVATGELPPPGAGLVTITAKLPAVFTSAAVNWKPN